MANRSNVSAENFVSAAIVLGTPARVAQRYKMKEATVIQRWKMYRKKGINLPELPKKSRGAKLDIEALNKQIAAKQKEMAAAE